MRTDYYDWDQNTKKSGMIGFNLLVAIAHCIHAQS